LTGIKTVDVEKDCRHVRVWCTSVWYCGVEVNRSPTEIDRINIITETI